MKISSINEALKFCESYRLISVGLSRNDENIIAWNTIPKKNEKLKEIKEFFDKKFYDTNEEYVLKMRNSTKATPTKIIIDTGYRTRTNDPEPRSIQSLNDSSNTVPFDKYMELLDQMSEYKMRCAEYESENRVLLQRIEDLKLELDSMDDESELNDQGSDTQTQIVNVLLAKVLQNSDAILGSIFKVPQPSQGSADQSKSQESQEPENFL